MKSSLLSPLICDRIQRDGLSAHFRHLFDLLPEHHSLREEYRRAWGWVNRSGEVRFIGFGEDVRLVKTDAGERIDKVRSQIITTVVGLYPELENLAACHEQMKQMAEDQGCGEDAERFDGMS